LTPLPRTVAPIGALVLVSIGGAPVMTWPKGFLALVNA